MNEFYFLNRNKKLLTLLLFLYVGMVTPLYAQSFSQTGLDFNGKGSVSNGTGIAFGPDGRLYMTEYTGEIKIFTIERIGMGQYVVQDTETLNGILEIQDHHDDGSLFSNTFRETIGITVVGTESHPVIYVTSSDFRIGGGGGGGNGDVGLDTNSGIITRFSWNGESWDVVDIVRGLPRSEENHATNNLEFASINGQDYLLVSQGGHTNGGSPSVNFAYTTEYALSAAVLSVNLSMVEAMPILNDNGRKYIYDLPTLDDPTRPNANGITNPDAPGYDGIDVNDPFGGNDGLNQAVVVPGGPIQIFSPGYRNTFDLVITQSGAVYVTDNGANGGWGGFPENEGMGGTATNNYVYGEPGSSSSSGGEKINNKDHLTLVTPDIHNYAFGSFYGGHPNPVRANPYGAGLYTSPAVTGNAGAVFRTKKYHPDINDSEFTSDPAMALPANWPPVKVANVQEGDYRSPGEPNPDGPSDDLIITWGTNTNAIDEYTASNFEGAMKGNLIAGVNTGDLRRVELNPDGTLKKLTPSFASGIGGDALGVTCNGDDQIFPGTIWVVTLNGKLVVLEPQDYIICIGPEDPGYDSEADNDFDGYTNQDELDNGSDPCNGGSQPTDFDKDVGGTLVSDLNDFDDDSDGIPDAEDPFQLGDPTMGGSDAFTLPLINELFSSNTKLKGYMGLGMTGLMNNGAPNPNWKNWLDRRDDPVDPNPNDILGGAIGAMTMQMTSGSALGNENTQEKAFQYGVQVSETTGEFIVAGSIVNFNAPLQLYGNLEAPESELGIFIGDGTQSNFIKFVITPTGLVARQEIDDVPQQPVEYPINPSDRPQTGVTFYFNVDPAAGEILLEYKFDNDSISSLGVIQVMGTVLDAIKQDQKDLAVGFIGTSNASGVEVEGTWDFLNVTGPGPYILKQITDIEHTVGDSNELIDLAEYFGSSKDSENLVYTIEENTNPAIGAILTGNIIELIFPDVSGESDITVRATDGMGAYAEQTFRVSVSEASEAVVLYRVNAGGPAIAAIDGGIEWGADTSSEKSPYLSDPGKNKVYSGNISQYISEVDLTTTSTGIYNSERAGSLTMGYSFPVTEAGVYEVRLYMVNAYYGTSQPGSRIFDVEIEGILYPELDDLDLSDTFGHEIGGVISQVVNVTDGVIDIVFKKGVENPLINGIEIIGAPGEGTPVENPIVVAEIPDQLSKIGDELDGSLIVSASGGDGNLTYVMSGAPSGIVIEPTNGQIGGSVNWGAAAASPYTVTVKVDDSDDHARDSITTSFTWTIHSGEPVVVEALPDLERLIGAPEEQLVLDSYFSDDDGLEQLIYTVEDNTNLAIGAEISGNLLLLNFPDSPAEAELTIRVTDGEGKFAEQSFLVRVREVPQSMVLYRVNAGGPVIAAIDGGIAWGADSASEKSPYLSDPGKNKVYSGNISQYISEVDLTTTSTGIYNSERAGSLTMGYSFPVTEAGVYEVRLYMVNAYYGTSQPGSRIFDVEIEGILYPELDDLDLSDTFGHEIGGVISQVVNVTDGVIDIVFKKGVENPLINGIEIIGAPGEGTPVENPIVVAEIPDQLSKIGDELDGSLIVSASGGDGNLTYVMSGAPSGIVIEPTNGQIGGSVNWGAAAASPYTVTVKVDDSDDHARDSITTSFTWTIHSGEPVVVEALPDLERLIGAPEEQLVLDSYFSDDDGLEQLIYTVENNTNLAIGAEISGNLLLLNFPDSPAEAELTIRVTDGEGNFVEQSFLVTVIGTTGNQVLYRINAGGGEILAIDGGPNWSADTRKNKSQYLVQSGSNSASSTTIHSYDASVDFNTTPTAVFETDRYDLKGGAPNITYSFPVSAGQYEVRIYMGNYYSGTSEIGTRIFNITLEDLVFPEFTNIDLIALFGQQHGGVVSKILEVIDGQLDISLEHGAIENPVINGIEIIKIQGSTEEPVVAEKQGDIVYTTTSVSVAKLFPNPANTEVYLEVPQDSAEIQKIHIYNFNGNLVRNFKGSGLQEGRGIYRLDLSGLPDGSYLVKFDSASGSGAGLQLVIKH